MGDWSAGVLIKQTVSFIDVVLSVHYNHGYPFICSKDYVVPIPFKLP